jgi:NAD(P)-dependent dehydrogenase (short-subunit alcohol dehydrogenase family)
VSAQVSDPGVALVTGAGRAHGIGRGIALALARQGFDVAVSDLARAAPALDVFGIGVGDDPAVLEETAELVRGHGVRSLAVAIDVTDGASVRSGVAAVVRELGGVDVLVNNAGTAAGAARFEEVTPDDWELSLRVNVLGAVTMVRESLPHLKASRAASIVNVASTLGVAALAEYGSYVVSKHAVVGLTRLLSQELGAHGIRTNAVAPGYVVTDMGLAEQAKIADELSTDLEGAVSQISTEIPIGRLGTPADVGDAVAWLAGPASSFVNGAVVPIHGGQIPGFA